MDWSDEWSRRRFLGAVAAGGAWAMAPGVGRAAPERPEAKGKIGTRKIPRTGEAIPMVGLGTWQTFDVGDESEEREPLREVLRRFFDLGGRVIDTSPMYGKSEAVLGDLLGELDARDETFLATKVWTRGEEAGIRQMRDSMGKLGMDKVELMQVHNLVDWETQLATLREWKEEGRIRYLGVTHWKEGAFDELEKIIEGEELDFVQLPYSIASREAEERLIPAAREHRIAVLVMRPFEKGSLFRQVRGKEVPEWAREAGIDSWARYFLKWILGREGVTCPIPATSDPGHLVDNMGAGVGPLPGEALRKRMVAHLGL